MTPRKASLRIAHSSKCANANLTALSSLEGCTCKPSYYVSWQTSDGKTRKSERVKDKRVAQKLLNEKQVEIDKGVVGYVERKDTTLPEWMDEYEQILELRNIKGETRRSYKDTLTQAKDALGWVKLRDIDNAALRKFYKTLDHTSEATRLRRLKELSACLNVAKDEGYLETNPVPAFKRSLRLRAPKTASPPFSDGELARLWAALGKEKIEPVYLAITKAAALTGARQGELIALTWDALDLTNGELHIRHTYNQVDGIIGPKDGDVRTVYLDAEAEKFFGEWIAHEGVKTEGLIFPAPRGGGHLNDDYLRKIVHKALEDAGIPLVDPDTALKRKPFHSLRASYARRMLEQGRHPSWVESNLGHSDLRLTMHVYGSWTREAMRQEAQRL